MIDNGGTVYPRPFSTAPFWIGIIENGSEFRRANFISSTDRRRAEGLNSTERRGRDGVDGGDDGD